MKHDPDRLIPPSQAGDERQLVTPSNSWSDPYLRWAQLRRREFMPTKRIWRGPSGVAELLHESADARDLTTLSITPNDSESLPLAEVFTEIGTTGFLVMQAGRTIFEHYASPLQPQSLHGAASVTKSFIGVLVLQLLAQRKIDPDAPICAYVPDLSGSGYGDATVSQVLDMRTSIRYGSLPPTADIVQRAFLGAIGYPNIESRPPNGPRSIYDFLLTARKEGEHGGALRYDGANTEVLGWLLRELTGQSIASLIAERIWQPMGAHEDSDIVIDRTGVEHAAGGLSLTLRDLARFGDMLRRGAFDEPQPATATSLIDVIAAEPLREQREALKKWDAAEDMRGWSYHRHWWIPPTPNGAFEAQGQWGQRLYVVPASKLVIAQFGADRVPLSAPRTSLMMAVYAAIEAAL